MQPITEVISAYPVVIGWALSYCLGSFLLWTPYRWWSNEYFFYRGVGSKKQRDKKTAFEIALMYLDSLVGLSRRVLGTALAGALAGGLVWRAEIEDSVAVVWGVCGAICWRVGYHRALSADEDGERRDRLLFGLGPVAYNVLTGSLLGFGGVLLFILSAYVVTGSFLGLVTNAALITGGTLSGAITRSLGAQIAWDEPGETHFNDESLWASVIHGAAGAIPWALVAFVVVGSSSGAVS